MNELTANGMRCHIKFQILSPLDKPLFLNIVTISCTSLCATVHISQEDLSLRQDSDSHWSYPLYSSQIGLWSPDTVSDPLSWDEMLCHHPFNHTESSQQCFCPLSSPTVTNVWTHHGLKTTRPSRWAEGQKKSGKDRQREWRKMETQWRGM